jgi:nuclear receptor co-repressor 1
MYDLSVVPPLCLEQRAGTPTIKFINNNGFVSDPVALFKSARNEMHWNEREKELFLEKLLTYGKNFDVIASFLDKKSAQDCVEYFYMTKKKVNYKLLIRKQQRKRKKDVKANPTINNNNNNNNNNNSGGGAAGGSGSFGGPATGNTSSYGSGGNSSNSNNNNTTSQTSGQGNNSAGQQHQHAVIVLDFDPMAGDKQPLQSNSGKNKKITFLNILVKFGK